jgi:hypothetical protein
MYFVKGDQTESKDWEVPIELYSYPKLNLFSEEVINPYILATARAIKFYICVHVEVLKT